MNCQHIIRAAGEDAGIPTALGRIDVQVRCGKPTNAWRQCGAGAAVKCKKEIAYCPDHGGDERAQQEMREHHKEHSK